MRNHITEGMSDDFNLVKRPRRTISLFVSNSTLLENTTIPSIDCRFDTMLSNKNLYYFYQFQDCQPYCLHPLNISMHKKQYGEYENFHSKSVGKL